MFNCIDCGINTHKINEYYMVIPKVWKEAKMKYHDGMLCIGCLENRIGRKLNKSDFSGFPINTAPFNKRSKRLQERMNNIC